MSKPVRTIDAINEKTTARVRSYFEARDEWNLSLSLKNLIEQAIGDYEHRTVLELVQNAHDAQPAGSRVGRILIRLDHDDGEHGTLIVANTGNPFSASNFHAICDVAQSDKRADEGIGNKGIGFKSTLQICRIPEIYSSSTVESDTFDGFCFRFAAEEDLVAAVGGDNDRARDLRSDVFHLCLPVALTSVPPAIAPLRSEGYVTAIRLPLKSEAAREGARGEIRALDDDPPVLLFLRRISTLVIEEREAGEVTTRVRDRDERSVVKLDERTTVTELCLGDAATFIVAERIVDAAAFRAAIERSVEADRVSAGWADWRGEARVGIGVPTGEPLPEGRLYTFLPMGEHATAPLPAHVNAPFFAKLARISFEESIPLNDFLLDEIALLSAAMILGASGERLQLEPAAVADLLSWTGATHKRLVSAFERYGEPLHSAPVLPLHAGGAWGSLTETRCWRDEGRSVLTAQAIARSAGARLLHQTITDTRLARLDAAIQTIVGRGLHATDDEVADWAEAIAAAAARRKFSPRWWEAFYDELAGAITDRAALRGRKILIDDDLRLQRCAGGDGTRGPTLFFSPRADDTADPGSDDDLRVPKTLRRQIVFVNQRLRWTRREGTTLVRRPGRRMLDQQTAGLVHEYRAAELFGVLNRALSNRPSPARAKDALHWAYRFVRSRADPPWSDIAGVAFQVPTAAGGWISAADAMFSREWEGDEDEVLDEFIARVSGLSDDLDKLAMRLVPSPVDWPFDIDDRHHFRQFLERLGVRSGLWPQPVARSRLSEQGRFFEDLSAHSSVPLPPITRGRWRSALGQLAPPNLRPYTTYRSRGPQYVLPGQADYERFDDATRRLYARLIVLGLERWREAMLDVEFRRYNDPTDRFSWPTPARAFLEEADWVPMARSGEREDWYYVRARDAWSHGVGDNAAPNFLPLVPHVLRQLSEQHPRSRARLEQLGIRFWDAVATAPDRVRLLAELLHEGDVDVAAAAAFRKAYEEAWEDAVRNEMANPLDGQAEPWIAATVRSRLEAVRLAGGDDAEPVYVQDSDSTQALRLLDQRPVPVVRLRRGIGDRVAEMLASVAGARIRRVSEAAVTVRVDGREFVASGQGENLTDGRPWLVDLIVALTELRSGEFRRLGSEAIRRTRETVQRTRLVLAEHIETLVDGVPVEGVSRALAVPDGRAPTIIVSREVAHGEASLLQASAPAIAELIRHPALADSIRLGLIDLAQRGALEGDGPSLAMMADILGEPAARLRELAAVADGPLFELARTLVPLVATVDLDVANELAATVDSFTDETAFADWLERRIAPNTDVSRLVSLAGEGDLDKARVELGIALPDLNAAIERLGPPFEPLRNPDGIDQAFRYHVHRHREAIMAALRAAYRDAYDAFDPLDEYLARRDLSTLRPPSEWTDEYYNVPDDVIRTHVEWWLAESGAVLTDADHAGGTPLDDLRRDNRSVFHDTVVSALPLVRAWEMHADQTPSDLPGAPETIVDLASKSGQLDFEPVSTDRAVAWLERIGRWPAGMPRSLDLADVGVEEAELEDARQRREHEERRRVGAARQLTIDGTTISVEPGNYSEFLKVVRTSITPKLLASRPEVADLPLIPPASGRGGGIRRGPRVTAARRRRLSDVQVRAVGLAGEVVALEWLKANYEDATDASWQSGYRNLVLGDGEGDDSLGYDFEVIERRRRLLFEVKASVSDLGEFDLTDAEIRAAQRVPRRDRYFILYVTHVLTSDERAVHLLPNPLGPEGLGRYRTVGRGLRLRFSID